MDLLMSNLSAKINAYSLWRESLVTGIDHYVDWLTLSGDIRANQELRLYDIKEILKKDQLVLAFLAEFSRGKTETIKALFFLTLSNVCCRANRGEPPCARTKFFGMPQKNHALNYYRLIVEKATIASTI
jgi:hypothetical protein